LLTTPEVPCSNVISNVLAILALKPFVLGLADRNRIWLVMAMSATLAGNLGFGG
jgi:Na+/H+ antiporter NhaD/arsenite permease-like protein